MLFYCDATLLPCSLECHCVHRQIFGIPLHPGLKPWANPMCPYRAINTSAHRRVEMRANEDTLLAPNIMPLRG